MLARFAVIAALAAVAATQIPALLQSPTPEVTTPVIKAAPPAHTAAAPAGSVQLAADGNGHYSGSFRINGKPVDGLIDTGATFVALNESTARRLGFTANGLDFAYAVNTANGQTKAARITLDGASFPEASPPQKVRLQQVSTMLDMVRTPAGRTIGATAERCRQ